MTAAALALPAFAETPRPPRAPVGMREVEVTNRTRQPIFQIRVSSSEAEQWGDDRLGDAILRPGNTFKVRLGRTRECVFDVQVIYEDLSHEERRGLDLCHIHAMTLDGSAAIRANELFAVARAIRLDNRGPRAIRQVFVSSASADQWGDDLAPPGAIPPGTVGGLVYRGGCVADLRLVYDNRAAEERRGIDLCAMPALIVRPGWTTEDTPPTPLPPGAIMLINRTARTVTALRLRPEEPAGAPSDDLLGAAVLPPGHRLVVAFDRASQCRFVARTAFGGDQEEMEQGGVDLCGDPEVTLVESRTTR